LCFLTVLPVLAADSRSSSSSESVGHSGAAAQGDTAAQADAAVQVDNGAAEVLAHDLSVELTPDRHELKARDRITLKVLTDRKHVSFRLNVALRVASVQSRAEAGSRPLAYVTEPVRGAPAAPSPSPLPGGERAGVRGEAPGPQHTAREEEEQLVTVHLNEEAASGQIVTLDWSYEGTINEPPREPRHLRFVTPSETAGHIGSEGVYLSGETHWYPEVPGSLPTFRLTVTTPEDWQAVTHGKQITRQARSTAAKGTVTAEWDVAAKTEALTLVANRFVVQHRDWRDPSGRPIEVAAYLFPEDASLAQEYLDASVRYLETYSKLLGSYPFPKFAVVENFFASGLGMPSFTLLGSGVIKRHYVQPYALGHEIVHSWFGNWLFNDAAQGNWVEGLTTYLANYYYDEFSGSEARAREQRRMMVLGYAVYVRPEEDYPVARFRQKVDQKDNAIGYQKAAMVFHMLRRDIGDEAFWSGLRRLVAERGGVYSTWRDVEEVFAAAAGRDLRWFFAQWVERPGAPVLVLTEALYRDGDSRTGQGSDDFVLQLRVVQADLAGEPYRLGLPVSVNMADGRTHRVLVKVESRDQALTLHLPSRPLSVTIDPDFDSFRRLAWEQLPPMLNLFVTDRRRTLVLPGMGTEADQEPYLGLAGQIRSREPAVARVSDQESASLDGSVLVLGGPSVNRAADWVAQACGGRVNLGRDRFAVEGKTYEGTDKALLVTCRRPDHPGTVVTLFYGLTPQAAAKVARLLFFYGWQSYLVFHGGTVVARGDFLPKPEDLEVRFDTR
jgi:hypothetical protein